MSDSSVSDIDLAFENEMAWARTTIDACSFTKSASKEVYEGIFADRDFQKLSPQIC